MALYQLYGTVVQSEIGIPELPLAEEREPECIFRIESGHKNDLNAVRWQRHWTLPTGEIWLSIAQNETHYLLRFPEMADFRVTLDGTQIICRPGHDIPPQTIQHLFLDQVLPLALSKRGKLMLHASAVALPAGVVAFAGTTGMGKSTLATSFSSQGFALMTDDCLYLDIANSQLLATPGYPGSRLWDDSIETLFEYEPVLSEVAHYSHKKRLAFQSNNLAFCYDTLPVKRIFFLSPDDGDEDAEDISIIRLAPREAFMALASYIFKLDVSDRDMLITDFNRLKQIAELSLCYRLSFPQQFSLLPQVRETILRHIGEA
jgi:hypothetical protein